MDRCQRRANPVTGGWHVDGGGSGTRERGRGLDMMRKVGGVRRGHWKKKLHHGSLAT